MARSPRPSTPQHEALALALDFDVTTDRRVPNRTPDGRHIDGMVIKALRNRGWITADREITDTGCVAIDRPLSAGLGDHRSECIARAADVAMDNDDSGTMTYPDAWLMGISYLDNGVTDCNCWTPCTDPGCVAGRTREGFPCPGGCDGGRIYPNPTTIY